MWRVKGVQLGKDEGRFAMGQVSSLKSLDVNHWQKSSHWKESDALR